MFRIEERNDSELSLSRISETSESNHEDENDEFDLCLEIQPKDAAQMFIPLKFIEYLDYESSDSDS